MTEPPDDGLRDSIEEAWFGASDTAADRWPAPPDDAAFHGVAGELVEAVRDLTEADPVAVLASILAIAGAIAGHNRMFYLGSQQAPNLFVALVGDSSSGRKGTSLSVAREIFAAAWSDWEGILVPGLGSGEGLIGHLKRAGARDDRPDHRALVLETEMGRVLGVMRREGSTLSPTLRDAWDGVPLGRFLAREDSLVTWHHVATLAHVTPAELRDKLTDTDAANGFGNRFLWLAVRRSKRIPFPRSLGSAIVPHVRALHAALIDAQGPAELVLTNAGAAHWEALYDELGEHRSHGLSGALTARAEAQIARLALVYAILDRSRYIDVAHLEAAEALWDYAARSVTFIFGDSTGNATADYIRSLLADGPMTREELRQSTGVREAVKLAAAITLLVDLRLVTVSKGAASGRAGRRPDVVELASLPAFPTGIRRPRARSRVAGKALVNTGNVDSAGVRTAARGPLQEMQEMQVIAPTAVDEPEDVDEPDDLTSVAAQLIGDALPYPMGRPA